MAALTWATFQGLRPRVSSRVLGEHQATVAVDCNLLGGDLRAHYADKRIQDAVSGAKSMYYWNEHATWLTWDSDVDVVRGAVANDAFGRIYITGDGVPQVRGGSNGSESYTLGVPQPATPPTIALTARTTEAWTIEWWYFFEETDGSRQDEGELSNSYVSQSKFGETYVISEPTRVNASDSAAYIPYAKAYDENGTFIGRVIPDQSTYAPDSSLIISGESVTGSYTSTTFTFEYVPIDLSDAFGSGTSYVYTFVSKWGEEGPPSLPSDSLTIPPVQAVEVSGIATSVNGDYAIEKVRVYRVTTDGTTGSIKYVDEFLIGQSTYVDEKLDAQLGELLEADDWFPPPTDMAGIVMHPGGFTVGFSSNTVYCSAVGVPHAYPAASQYPFDYDIVGLGVAGNSIVVLTKGLTYVLIGELPDAMTPQRVDGLYPCVSKRSIASDGEAVLYAAADGLVAVSGYKATLLTESLYKREQWRRDIVPSGMVGEIHDSIYYGWSGTNSIAINFDEGVSALSTMSVVATGAWRDLETDSLYLLVNDDIVGFQQDETARKTATWRSREFTTGSPEIMAVARIIASSNPVTFRLYNESGTMVAERSVANDHAFRLPSVRRGLYWSIELEFACDVDRVNLGQSMMEVS